MAHANAELVDADVHYFEDPQEHEEIYPMEQIDDFDLDNTNQETLKQRRKSERGHITRLGNSISAHIEKNKCRNELSKMAAEYAETVNFCKHVYRKLCDAKGFTDERDDLWVTQLDTQTSKVQKNIETYLQTKKHHSNFSDKYILIYTTASHPTICGTSTNYHTVLRLVGDETTTTPTHDRLDKRKTISSCITGTDHVHAAT